MLSLLIAVFEHDWVGWLLLFILSIYAAPVWLILCACLVPAPLHYDHKWKTALWKIGWYFLFIIIHLVILCAATVAVFFIITS